MVRCLITAVVLCLAGCGIDSEVSRSIGARCVSSDDCDDRCLTGPEFPGGFCSLSCDDDADCPGSSICVEREGGVCLYLCEVVADCEFLGDGWECVGDAARPGGEDVLVCRAD
jgi:hypothetical protein